MRRINFAVLLVLLSLSVFCMAEAPAPVRTALVGHKNLVDLLTTRLSDDKDIELLERSEIDRIISEHKLNPMFLSGSDIIKCFPGTGMFSVISSSGEKEKEYPSGIVVFNAKNGFRLASASLPGNIEKAAESAVEELRKARLKTIIADPVFLSVVAIRDGGVPEKYKYKISQYAVNVEDRLSRLPRVQMLERDYLENVNQERKLTETLYQLVPSAQLISLEFIPGANPDIVNMTATLTDSGGRILLRCRADDCFADDDKTINMLIEAGCKFFRETPPKDTYDSKKEALRFANEARFASKLDFNTARRKYNAAIALDPASLQYRYELALLLVREAGAQLNRKLPERDYDTYYKMAVAGICMCEEIRREKPDYDKNNLFRNLFYTAMFISTHMEWAYSNGHILTPPEYFITEIIKVRKYAQIEFSNQYPTVFDNAKPFNTVAEILNYQYILYETYKYVFSPEENLNSYLQDIGHFARRIEDFIKRNPDRQSELEEKLSFSSFPGEHYLQNQKYRQWVKKMLNRNIGIMESLKSNNLKQLQMLGYMFEFTAAADDALKTPETWKAHVENYAKQMEAVCLNDKITAEQLITLMYFFRLCKSHVYYNCTQKIQSIFDAQTVLLVRRSMYYPDALASFISSESIDRNEFLRRIEIAENVIKTGQIVSNDTPTMKTMAVSIPKISKANFEKYNVPDKYYDFENLMKQAMNLEHTEIQLKTGAENTKFLSKYGSNGFFVAAGIHDNIPYMLYYTRTDRKLHLIKYVNADFIEVSSFLPKDKIEDGNSPLCLMYMGKFYAGHNDGLYVFPLDGRTPSLISDIPGKYVTGIAGLKGRIYFSVCDKRKGNSPSSFVLMSCLPDGTDRKIHVSTLDLNRRNTIDNKTPYLIELLVGDEAKNRLIIITKTPDTNFYALTPDTNAVKSLFDKDKRICLAKQADSRILFFAEPNSIKKDKAVSGIYDFDIAQDKFNFLLQTDRYSSLRLLACHKNILMNGLELHNLSAKGAKPRKLVYKDYYFCNFYDVFFIPKADGRGFYLMHQNTIFQFDPEVSASK